MQKKGKGGKQNKGQAGGQKKAPEQPKGKETIENPAAGLANLQNELMSKIAAMKEGLLKGEAGEGLGKDMIDNLFKNLLGDMGMGGSSVDRKQYLESESAHQESMATIDETLTKIEEAYDKIMAGNLEEFEVAPEKDPEYTLQPADEAKYIKENKVYADINKKLKDLDEAEKSKKQLFDSFPEESVCKKHFDLYKQVNDITRTIYNGNLNYLRMKFLEKK